MAENTYAIEASRNIDRNELEDLSSSPPSAEDGFVKFRYRQKEAPQRERRPSLYDYFTQEGGALMSMIGGKSVNSNISKSTARKNSIGGTLSFDQFGEIDFDDFEEISSRHPHESRVAPLIGPAFETLEHSDALDNNQASRSIGDSTIQTDDNVYADEALDNAHFQHAPTPKNITGRKNSIILDTVTSLNINALQFGNENGNSHKRKISSITNPMFTSVDIDITKQENVDKNSTKSPIYSLNENVVKTVLPNIQTQSTIFDGATKSLELSNTHVEPSNAHVYSTGKQNEVEDAGDKQLVRKSSFIQSAIEPIRLETSNAGGPVMERRISNSIMNFFTGVLDKSVTGSSVERAQEVKEIADMNMLFRY